MPREDSRLSPPGGGRSMTLTIYDSLLACLEQTPEFRDLREGVLDRRGAVSVEGVSGAGKALLCAGLLGPADRYRSQTEGSFGSSCCMRVWSFSSSVATFIAWLPDTEEGARVGCRDYAST